MTLQADQIFAHFKVIRKLGEGGMGEVYLAEDQKLNRQVALKIVPPEFSDNRDRLDRFTREAKTAAKVSHANVMAIYDIGSAPDESTGKEYSYIVMEYIDGDTLTEHLRNRNLSLTDRLRLAEHIASGLAAAHKLSIVHRDIKTDNIMIDDEGEPRILDFGLAKPIASAFGSSDGSTTQTASQELTQEGKIVGTVNYMSPEQARGDNVDARSDIFSFGIMLYQMFTGKLPFDGGDRVSTIAKILEAKQIPIRQVTDTLPPELERIIDKCLQKNPNDRYQDTRDLVVDLRSLRRQFESGVSDITATVTGVDMPKPKSRSITFTGIKLVIPALFVIAVVYLVYYYINTSGNAQPANTLQARENALAVLGFENKTGDPELDWMTAGLPEILVTDLVQGGTSNIISRGRVMDCLKGNGNTTGETATYQQCVAAAKTLGASRVLSGSFYKVGEQIRIDARIEDTETGNIIMGEKVVGSDPFALVDSLTHKVAGSLNLQGLSADRADVTSYTSSSPEAYKQYILGMEQFGQNRFEDAINHFKKAVEIDTAFALAYMRVGMAYAFHNRQQAGVPWFQAALRHEQKLPTRERNLLDIYSDIWLKNKLDDAYIKLQTFVSNYPDDKEGRAILALFLGQITRKPEEAKAQLDTVLMLDPKFQLALQTLADLYENERNLAKAVEYTMRVKQYYPESPTSYLSLASLYRQMGRYDDGIRECQELLARDPKNRPAFVWMNRLYICKRDLASARNYVEKIRENAPDDPYQMMSYHNLVANLLDWQGKFDSALKQMHESIKWAKKSNDSARVWSQYMSMSQFNLELGRKDSAVYYAERSREWASGFRGLNYPIIMINVDPNNAEKVRPQFQKSIDDFKSRLPEEAWPLADGLVDIFEGLATLDTARAVRGFADLRKAATEDNAENRYSHGHLLVVSGKYAEGLEVLKPLVSGEQATTDGFQYLTSQYFIGRANEALGNSDAAKQCYQEVLKYWGKPEFEIKEIADSRERLARLTS